GSFSGWGSGPVGRLSRSERRQFGKRYHYPGWGIALRKALIMLYGRARPLPNFFRIPGEMGRACRPYNGTRAALVASMEGSALMKVPDESPRRPRRHYVVAMVLGTALTALGAPQARAAEAPETTARAVNDVSRYCTACWRNARLPPDCW